MITACHVCNDLIYRPKSHESWNACFFHILFPETAKLRLFNKTVLGIIFISGLTFNDMVYNITFNWLQRYRCCFASRLWEECDSTVFYMIQRKFQLSRMVIVKVVTPLNLYKIEPGATFIWIDMHIFRNFHHNFSFFTKPPFEQIYHPRLLYLLITWPQM